MFLFTIYSSLLFRDIKKIKILTIFNTSQHVDIFNCTLKIYRVWIIFFLFTRRRLCTFYNAVVSVGGQTPPPPPSIQQISIKQNKNYIHYITIFRTVFGTAVEIGTFYKYENIKVLQMSGQINQTIWNLRILLNIDSLKVFWPRGLRLENTDLHCINMKCCLLSDRNINAIRGIINFKRRKNIFPIYILLNKAEDIKSRCY